MFSVVDGMRNKVIACASDGSSTYYVGQLVTLTATAIGYTPGAVKPLAMAAGEADVTNKQVVFGVVTGFNERNPLYDSTYGQKAAGVASIASQAARTGVFNQGMYAIGDPQLLVMVQRITPLCVLEGPIFNATQGTAPTVITDSNGSDTTGYTTAGTTTACDFTPVANLGTIFCRLGTNAGLYRKTLDASATAPQVTTAFKAAVAKGDSFVRVPACQGFAKMQINSTAMFVDCSVSPATNTFHIVVEKLMLEVAGQERMQFSFLPTHFEQVNGR